LSVISGEVVTKTLFPSRGGRGAERKTQKMKRREGKGREEFWKEETWGGNGKFSIRKNGAGGKKRRKKTGKVL